MSQATTTRFVDPTDALSRSLRCVCHLLVAIHFALSGTSSVALVVLLSVYAATALALLHPALHFGSLVATFLLIPTLTVLVLSDQATGANALPFALLWGAFSLIPVGIHFTLYAVTTSNEKPDGTMLVIDVLFVLVLAGFVLYQHHPTSLATFATNVVRHGWFIGIAVLSASLIGGISYAVRN